MGQAQRRARPTPRRGSGRALAVTTQSMLLGGGPVLLLAAAAAPPLRPAAALAILVGWAWLRLLRSSPASIAWAAVLPVALLLAAPWIVGTDVSIGETLCVSPVSVIAARRMVTAGAILAVVAALAVLHDSGAAELGLRRPTGPELLVALGGILVLAAAGLWVGPWFARPFFGDLSFPVPPAALVPAILFGLANGVLEEVAYRGSVQAWLGRVARPWVAIAVQGLVFGFVHAGPEVVGLLPLHVTLMTMVGIAGGLVRHRTGSLAIPIGIHVGADIALYVGLACRAAA